MVRPMNQTPEDPQGPDGAPTRPPYEPGDTPPTAPAADDGITLTPLDEMPTGRRFLSVGRLVAVTVVVLALVGGAAAFALGGNDDDPKDDGVASIDGTTGDVDNDGSEGAAKGSPEDQSEMYDAMLEFAECMRDHGIDMPDPEIDGDGVRIRSGQDGGPGGGDEEKLEAAHEACEHIMEDAKGNMPAPSPEERAEMQDKLVAMAECMRARGYDMPDPEVDDNGGVKMKVNGGPEGPEGNDEQFQKDQEECNQEAGMEEGPGGGGGTEKGES
jgi:hypothetical protein